MIAESPYKGFAGFNPETRVWRLPARLFAWVQEECQRDPRWAEKQILPLAGPGEIRLEVI